MSHLVQFHLMAGGPTQLSSNEVIAQRYVVRHGLGAGGMGTAYLADDLVHDRPVTLKLLRESSPPQLEAFRHEFSVLRGLAHPHLTRVHDFEAYRRADGSLLYFYTSDFVDGTSLAQLGHGLAWEELRTPLAHALSALQFLHELGIRHGDFKPDNVLVDRTGRGVLIDLSCSAPLSEPAATVSGTLGFLAPELLRGATFDERADLFAVGVSLRSLLSYLRAPLPSGLERLVEQLTQNDPRLRPTAVREVLDHLGAPTTLCNLRPVVPPKLLGRAVAVGEFEKAIGGLLGGAAGSRAMCVCGAHGVGRSRLLLEWKWSAQLRARVVEGSARRARPVPSMLERALGGVPVGVGLAPVLEAKQRLQQVGEPVVLFLDDAQALGDADRELLHALARSLTPTDSVLLAWATVDPPPAIAGTTLVTLEPLPASDIALWAQGMVPPSRIPDVVRLTGGFPSLVQGILSQMAAGHLTEMDLDQAAAPLSSRQAARMSCLDAPTRDALASVAALGGRATDEQLSELGVDDAAMSSLCSLGFLSRSGTGFHLVRAAEAEHMLSLLPASEVEDAHKRVAALLASSLGHADPQTQAENMARAALCLLRTREVPEARAIFLQHRDMCEHAPRAWASCADALVAQETDIASLLGAAEVQLTVGRPDHALSTLARVLRRRPPERFEGVLHRNIGAAYLQRDNVNRAFRHLRQALAHARDPSEKARTAELLSRAYILSGAYAQAFETAREGHADGLDTRLRARLEDDLGVAAVYLGDVEAARQHLATAAALHADAGRPRSQHQSLSYRGFHEYRAGNSVDAARYYRDALQIAQTHGLSDRIAYTLVSLGAACHQNGDWGEALRSYDEGLRYASLLAQTSAEVHVRFNLAKLYEEIGLFERALAVSERGAKLAEEADLRFMVAAFATLRGQVAFRQGEPERAKEETLAGYHAFLRDGAKREGAETALQLVEAHLSTQEFARAQEFLDEAKRWNQELRTPDVEARMLVVTGKLLLATRRHAEAVQVLEDAVRGALGVGQQPLRYEALGCLAEAWKGQGADANAQSHAQQARQGWERIAASLPPTMRDAFWLHPQRKGLELPRPVSRSHAHLIDKLRRLIDINAKLNSSLKSSEVLSRTLDAAIELTGAERGFLLLRANPQDAQSELAVAVARNLDRETVGKGALKFSRSIAEKCTLSGEPVMTVDARADERFRSHKSVHAMRLQSVICVPIRSPGGILGAVYLDNRFQRGRFGPEDLDLLLAFATQASIALTNARLHDELEQRTMELEAERKRVEQLMHSQAETIDRLADEVRTKQQVLEHRYDYGNIVGRSAAMQSVFRMLDRVTEVHTPVLIQGESGTGKELVARAIHFNGPRRSHPFVAINCGAVAPTLLESELFGHVRGAFTGADRDKEGLLASARHGTVFLDEIGEMPLNMQVKLLRVLQQKEVRPVGSNRVVKTDFRLVCATNRRLRDEVAEGRFREDLFYRIGVMEIALPPLRDRMEDLPELVRHILSRVAQENQRALPTVDRRATSKLMAHHWPGNVRELENVLTAAFFMCTRDRIAADDIYLPASPRPSPARLASRSQFESDEADRICAALAAHRWNVTEVARVLGIPRPTLYRKLRRYGIKTRQ